MLFKPLTDAPDHNQQFGRKSELLLNKYIGMKNVLKYDVTMFVWCEVVRMSNFDVS